MNRLIWNLQRWLAARYARWVIQPSLNVYGKKWTARDEATLRDFLQSETGEHLQAVLLAHIQTTDLSAVSISTPHACGYATGQRALLANLIFLSGHVPPQVDESEADEQQGIVRLRNPFPESSHEKLAHS